MCCQSIPGDRQSEAVQHPLEVVLYQSPSDTVAIASELTSPKRVVNDEQLTALREELFNYQQHRYSDAQMHPSITGTDSTAGFPPALIDEVLDKAQFISTYADCLQCLNVPRANDARAVFGIIRKVFGDIPVQEYPDFAVIPAERQNDDDFLATAVQVLHDQTMESFDADSEVDLDINIASDSDSSAGSQKAWDESEQGVEVEDVQTGIHDLSLSGVEDLDDSFSELQLRTAPYGTLR